MFGWCNDQLCVLQYPSTISGYYFVSFRPGGLVQCLYAEPVVIYTKVYVIDLDRTCFLEHGNMFSYIVCVRDGFCSIFVPSWRVRRNDTPYSMAQHHKHRLMNF